MKKWWGPDCGLAMEDAGEEVWWLVVRSRKGGGANREALEDIIGTAKNEEVSGRASDTRASLPLPPPLSSPSLPLSAKYAPASSKAGGGESLGSERPRLDIFCTLKERLLTTAVLSTVIAAAE